jgi:hypothetical protein
VLKSYGANDINSCTARPHPVRPPPQLALRAPRAGVERPVLQQVRMALAPGCQIGYTVGLCALNQFDP